MANVRDAMTDSPRTLTAASTVVEAAKAMRDEDAGIMPVVDGDQIEGVITDRDIAIRAVGEHKSPDTPVRDVMTPQVLYCFEDETIEHVAENMGEKQVRRLPVLTREKRLVGIVSLGDVSRKTKPNTAGKAVAAISQPGGEHSQSLH